MPALNTLPGVRADERSPGSYRLAIRGSAIRSPFGVRNIKTYWNELPLTDAGGNTPLNALDVRALGRIEVIKGPSGSLYGAGTGGTILFSGLAVPANKSSVEVSALGGSYGLYGNGIALQTGKNNSAISLNYNHLQSDGYRDQSAVVRDNLSLIGSFSVSPKRTVFCSGFIFGSSLPNARRPERSAVSGESASLTSGHRYVTQQCCPAGRYLPESWLSGFFARVPLERPNSEHNCHLRFHHRFCKPIHH